jgi:DNA-binding transcriptional regulator YiaG
MDQAFPRKLREFRRKNAITQKALASLIGVDYVTINRWENGRGKPQQAKLDVLEELMKNGLPLNAVNNNVVAYLDQQCR